MENKEKQAELKEVINQLKNEYYRSWRANNKDKVKGYNKNYWERRALEKLEGVNAKN